MKNILDHKVITDINREQAYLERWTLRIPFVGWSIKIHKIMRADDDRCHHDHPWWMLRVILWGGYDETTGEDHRKVIRRPGNVSFCKRNFQHRITRLHGECSWSLVITGKSSGKWGFFTKQGFMYWRDFVDAARSRRILWCNDGTERGKSTE